MLTEAEREGGSQFDSNRTRAEILTNTLLARADEVIE
jgi:hypothetical protein